MTTELHVLRVFTTAAGAHGNPLGVFLDGGAIPLDDRQRVAADLGFSETVFVDDVGAGRIRIHTPAAELPFAGHPTVGTGWLLDHLGAAVDRLHCPAGELPTWADRDGLRWVRARPEWVHPITIAQLDGVQDVEGLAGPPPDEESYYAWAWEDEATGLIRSRYFVPRLGIGEDEATGAAAVVMAARLERSVTIRQGRGSILHARPASGGFVEVGGRCGLDAVRPYPVRRDTPALRAVEAAGMPHRIVATEPARDAEESASLQGLPLGALIRTIVVRRGADDYLFLLVPGGRRLDWPKLRSHLGVSRLSLPDAEEARSATGYERGAITPFGAEHAWPVIADESIARYETVAIGGGARGVSIQLAPDDLVAALGASVVDVTTG